MSNSAPIVDRIRIIPRPDDFLDRNVGSSGEVFFNKATNSLRVYSGKDRSGFEIARADLTNVDVSGLNITNDDINWIPYAELADLPSATDNHGMFAHVHATGRAYYAHAGNWIPLANLDEISGEVSGASVDVSDTVPSSPSPGNLWLDTNTGKLYIYYDDGDTAQWIQPSSSTGGSIASESDTLATITARGATTDNAVIINNTLTVDELETSGAGTPTITSASTITLTAADATIVTGGPFRLPSFTTLEKSVLSPVNGDMIYDSTLNKAQVYENGAWASLV